MSKQKENDLDNIYRVLEEVPYNEIIPHFPGIRESRLKNSIKTRWNNGQSINEIIDNMSISINSIKNHNPSRYVDAWKK